MATARLAYRMVLENAGSRFPPFGFGGFGRRLHGAAGFTEGFQIAQIVSTTLTERYNVVTNAGIGAMQRDRHQGASAQVGLTQEFVPLEYPLALALPRAATAAASPLFG